MGLLLRFFGCDVTGSALFSQFCMYVQLFSRRGGGGCSAVCTHPSDHSGYHSLQQYTWCACIRIVAHVLLSVNVRSYND